jgi:hypothetical protein
MGKKILFSPNVRTGCEVRASNRKRVLIPRWITQSGLEPDLHLVPMLECEELLNSADRQYYLYLYIALCHLCVGVGQLRRHSDGLRAWTTAVRFPAWAIVLYPP